MKNSWLNLVLSITNYIYERKKMILGRSGLSVVKNIVLLIILEIILAIVSLPLYFTLKTESVTAFLLEKGTYEKVSFDYNLRRVLTLAGVEIIALIWLVKLLLILFLPSFYGPMNLYTVSNLDKAAVLSGDLISEEIGIETARIIDAMPQPKIEKVARSRTGGYDFFGAGQPGSTVVLLLSDEQTAVYTADVDEKGYWEINHSQANFRLKEGNHSVVVFSYDKKLEVRSHAAPEQFFKVTADRLNFLVKNVDVLANWSAVIILLLGIFLTLLTI